MMAILGNNSTLLAKLRGDRAIQLGWLCFAAPAVTIALAGIPPYIRLVTTVCDREPCLAGQLSSADVQALLQVGITLTAGAEWREAVPTLFVAAFAVLTAAFGIWRRPTDPAVALLSFVLTAFGTGEFAQALAREAPSFHLPADLIRLVHVAGLALCLALIPDGRFRPPWLGGAATGIALIGVPVALHVAGPRLPIIFAVAIIVLAVGNLAARHRALQLSAEREQMGWTFAGLALLAGAQVVGRPLRLVPLPAIALPAPLVPAFALAPANGMVLLIGGIACLAITLLRDELTELELVFNRALVYGTLTLFVVGAYVLVVGALSLLFSANLSFWFSLVATGLIAALFQPLRARVQRVVNHLCYGRRDEPYAVVAQLGRQLEGALDPDTALPTIVETVATALKLPYVAIAIGGEDDARGPIAYGAPPAATVRTLSLPLIYQGVERGRLIVAPRHGEAGLMAADRRLLEELARQVGVAAHALEVTNDLRRSREQIVTAREEERRRLRRDLHDGLGPMLGSLTLKLDIADEMVDRDPAAAHALLRSLKAQTKTAISDIRHLVYALRPPALDDLGLVEALREIVAQYDRGGVCISIDAPEHVPALPAAVEVAAYRIVQEALTNVIRHAEAQHCTIRLVPDPDAGVLRLEISDDGRGLDLMRGQGVGMAAMRERAAELGGSCMVEAMPTGGTCVRALLPCGRWMQTSTAHDAPDIVLPIGAGDR